jgi:hypothetical protein
MSALTNDPFTLARFAGMYKAIQSSVRHSMFAPTHVLTQTLPAQQGSAGSFGMDAVATPFLNEHVNSFKSISENYFR